MRKRLKKYISLFDIVKKESVPPKLELGDPRTFSFFYRHKLFPDHKNLHNKFTYDQKGWKQANKDRTVKSIFLSKLLIDIFIRLQHEGIQIIPLKGPIVAVTIYRDVGKRHFGDLDLKVRRKDVPKVIEALGQIGYKQIHPRSAFTEKQWNYYFKWKKDIGLVNRELGVFVELHIGIYYHELLNKEKEQLFFENLTEERLAGITVRCMNRDNTFLYLTYHGAQHMYFRLFWLRDVAEALKRWDLDHAKILRTAYDMGIERLVGVSLELAREFFSAEIPQEYHVLLAEKRVIIMKLKKLCIKRILGPEELNFTGKLRKHYYIMSLKPGFRYKWVAFQSIFHRWYIRKFLGGN